MRIQTTLLFCFVTILNAYSTEIVKPVVSVLPVTTDASINKSSLSILSSTLEENLVKNKSLRLVERKKLEVAIEEIELSSNSAISNENAQRIGQILAADIIVLGIVNRFDDDKNTFLYLKLINVETGEILWSSTVEGGSLGVINNKLPNVMEKLNKQLPIMLLKGKQKEFVADYISKLSLTVYLPESSKDNQVIELGIKLKNLFDKSLYTKYNLIDYSQAERSMNEKRAAKYAEDRKDISFFQYLASKYLADLYLQIEPQITRSNSGCFISTIIKLISPTNATILWEYRSPEINVIDSERPTDKYIAYYEDAILDNNIIDIESSIKQYLDNGLKYEVTVYNTPDEIQTTKLFKAIGEEEDILDYKIEYISTKESKVLIFSFQPINELLIDIYSAGDKVGMPDLYLYYYSYLGLILDSGF